MLTPRGLGLIAGSAALWLGSRMLAGPDLHLVAVGLIGLPAFALISLARPSRPLQVSRRLSSTRVFPGGHIEVSLELRGDGLRGPVLCEDALPSGSGRGARAVVVGEGAARRMRYTLTCRTRGRYRVGPLTVFEADPFDLARRRREVAGTHEFVVFPEVEDLRGTPGSAPALGTGDVAARRVFQTGDTFYTIRSYEVGDDLRRIHWPSSARTGQLMIRQDEATRRSAATILLDNRIASLGGRRETFEKGVSAAASVALHLARSGASVRLATADVPAKSLDRTALLEHLAVVGTTRGASLLSAVRALRESVAATDLVVVTHPPLADETAELARLRGGRRTVIIIHPRNAEPTGAAAAATLRAAGWEVVSLPAEARLRDVWHRVSAPVAAGS